MIYLTRRERFNSSNRLHVDSYSDEKNKTLFGRCNNSNGHGHNFELFVTLKGKPDPETGLIMNLDDLKQIIRKYVTDKFDHKHLNYDIPELKGINPSLENLTVVVWTILKPQLPLLYEITIIETENNKASYRGE